MRPVGAQSQVYNMEIIYENGKYYEITRTEMPEGFVLDREIGKLQEQLEAIKVEITKLEKVKDYGKEKDSEIVKEREGS